MWTLLLLAGAGCGAEADDGPTGPGSLMDPWSFDGTGAAEDPMAEHRPEVVACPDSSFLPEGMGLEIDSGACNYLAVSSPSLRAVRPGDTLRTIVSHFSLDFPGSESGELREAHFAVQLGDLLLTERAVDIPSGQAEYVDRVVAEKPLPAGTPLHVHLHNHGANSWKVARVEIESSASEP